MLSAVVRSAFRRPVARNDGRGEDPIPEPLPARLAGGPTVADLAARYMEKHVAVSCKASTAEGIRGLLGKYVLAEIGKLPPSPVTVSGDPSLNNEAATGMGR